jgi:hypothetical protein
VFTNTTGRVYAIDRIAKVQTSYEIDLDNSTYVLSVNASVCGYNPDCPTNSYVCMRGENDLFTSYANGKVVSITENAKSKGITLSWQRPRNYTISLRLDCDPTSDAYELALDKAEIINGTIGSVQLSITSSSGCPACADEDFKFNDSPCVFENGGWQRTRNWYQVNAYCYRGKSLPLPQTSTCVCHENNGGCSPIVSCTQDFNGPVVCGACPGGWSGNGTYCSPICGQGCQNGAQCIAPGVCDCTDTGFTGSACDEVPTKGFSSRVVGALIAIGALILAVAIGFSVVLYLRHRRLYAEYSKLAGGGGVSMEDHDVSFSID